MVPRLLERYRKDVRARLSKEFGYTNVHQVPTLTKIVLNVGLGEATQNAKLLERAAEELAAIAGQKPLMRKARKSVANFKLRQGQAIGAMVTLRGDRMWEFLDRLMNVALPRVRDFRGVSPRPSTAAATTRSGSASRSSSPRSTTTRSRRSPG